MILELDCGNTLIKWRLLGSEQSGFAKDNASLLKSLSNIGYEALVTGIRLVSVRSADETQAIASALEKVFGLSCNIARSAERLGGVRNGYEDYHCLGMDRWLAIVGAYDLARKACVIIDLGTAITVDFVSSTGEHFGGFICPGISLLRAELSTHTSRIRYGAEDARSALLSTEPGRSTASAVERGCLWMVRGFVREQLVLAARLLDSDYEVFLTGGDARLIREHYPDARFVPDLVFTGLAIACPLE